MINVFDRIARALGYYTADDLKVLRKEIEAKFNREDEGREFGKSERQESLEELGRAAAEYPEPTPGFNRYFVSFFTGSGYGFAQVELSMPIRSVKDLEYLKTHLNLGEVAILNWQRFEQVAFTCGDGGLTEKHQQTAKILKLVANG